MAFLSFFTVLIIFYFVIYLLKCDNKLRCLERLGLEVGLFQIKWFTQRFNRLFLRCGNGHKKLIVIWFTIGSIFSVLLILPAMLLLVRTFISNLLWLFEDKAVKTSGDGDSFVLTPVVPGLNMPLARTGHYVLTLLVCSVVHELGHAVTSVADDVTVLGAGLVVLLFFPAAYVDLSTIELSAVKKHQQLRIFTAGIWNNIVLSLVAFLILLSMPYLCSPLYSKDQGISVIHVEANSTILGPSGLKVGDVITSLNGCNVRDGRQWQHCLSVVDHSPVQYFCVEVSTEPETEDCCKNDTLSASSLCFSNPAQTSQHCLKVRSALEASSLCNVTAPACRSSATCLQPVLKHNSKLIQVKRSNDKDFLFVGNPAEVFYYTQVTDYILIYYDHWSTYLFTPGLPSTLELLWYYIASMSAGLAVLNAVPCFMLDGQHVARVLVDSLFYSLDNRTKSVILLSITIVGTLLIVLNISLGVLRLVL